MACSRVRQSPALLGALACLIIFLSGCSPLIQTAAPRQTESPLTRAHYAAAEILIQQARSALTPATPVTIGVMTDFDNPNEITNFGRLATEQIASRFVQLGYSVTATGPAALGIPPSSAAAVPGPQVAGQTAAAGSAMITGQYAAARDTVLVNLRLVDSVTDMVIAAHDYEIRRTANVRELLKTRTDKDSFFSF